MYTYTSFSICKDIYIHIHNKQYFHFVLIALFTGDRV